MIRRLDLGYFVRPADEAGEPQPRVEAVLGYVIRRPEGVIVFDTGIGEADPGTEAHYRPHRRPLPEALSAAGVSTSEVKLVANCHLHFDHCGGNAHFPQTPVLVQRRELEAARGADYTVPELVDFPGVAYEEFDGEAEIMSGVWLLPTPGHTAGHQSLAVRQDDGTVILAGQAHDFSSHFASAVLARRAGVGTYPAWLHRILEFDPRRVLFAHDASVWEPA